MLTLERILRGLLVMLAAVAGSAAAAAAVNIDGGGVAVGGYDVVAYFVHGLPQRGQSEFSAAHDGATYRFASAANLAAFRADPDRYVPQYGGYCAYGAARGYKAPVDPTAWRIVEGKLYLNYNHEVQKQWLVDPTDQIRKADAQWPRIRDK
jgi:YHS domain-containing protein